MEVVTGREGDVGEGERGRVGVLEEDVLRVEIAYEEIMLLWGLYNPAAHKQGKFVKEASQVLEIEACGQQLKIMQAPSAMTKPGVTGAVMWDSGIILAKFLEHACDSGRLHLRGKRCVELGAGCGLVGCVAALLGAEVVTTDLWDRLRLLQKNLDQNDVGGGRARVAELTWGEDLRTEVALPAPDFVLASDVVYNESVVPDLVRTLGSLCEGGATAILAAELRNDSVLMAFLEAAMEHGFAIGRLEQYSLHPQYSSRRVVVYVMCLRSSAESFSHVDPF